MLAVVGPFLYTTIAQCVIPHNETGGRFIKIHLPNFIKPCSTCTSFTPSIEIHKNCSIFDIICEIADFWWSIHWEKYIPPTATRLNSLDTGHLAEHVKFEIFQIIRVVGLWLPLEVAIYQNLWSKARKVCIMSHAFYLILMLETTKKLFWIEETMRIKST